MTSQPLVAVVMVNWNTARETLQSVESVLKSDHDNLAVIVVDNGSRPQEMEILSSGLPQSVKLLALDKNYGYVGGVNRGLKQADKLKPVYIMVMNNDTVVDPAAISELLKASRRHKDECIVTGVVYDYHQPDIIQQTGSLCINRKRLAYRPLHRNVSDPGLPDDELSVDMIDDVFWLMHLDVFRQVGFYCDYFWFNDEQADYALRAVDMGFKLICTPRAKLWHMGSLSIGGRSANPVREYFDIKSRLILRYRHLSKLDFAGYYLETLHLLVKSVVKMKLRPGRDSRQTRRVARARIYGLWDFHKWILRKHADNGQYPQALRGYKDAQKILG